MSLACQESIRIPAASHHSDDSLGLIRLGMGQMLLQNLSVVFDSRGSYKIHQEVLNVVLHSSSHEVKRNCYDRCPIDNPASVFFPMNGEGGQKQNSLDSTAAL